MAMEAELRHALERAERRRSVVMRVLPYVLLAVSLVFTLLQALVDPGVNVAAVLVLTAAAAGWVHLFGRHPEWHQRPALMGVQVAGVVALAGGLVAASPWYGFFAFMGYVYAEMHLRRRWKYVGVVATAVVTSAAYLGGYAGLSAGQAWLAWPPVAVVVAVLASAFMRFAEQEDKRSLWQRQSLDELHAANVQLEEALRDNAALHAQLLVQAREAGVQDERQRMAREIHDTLAQGLAGILAQLQAAEQTLRVGSPERRQVTAAIVLAREGLTEARRTVHAVEPQVLADSRLPEAIQGAVARWSEEHGVEGVLTTTGHPRPLRTDVEVTLLRTAQEALANVAKHARAGRVVLTLSYMEDVVTLDVLDDGIGFEAAAVRGPGASQGQTAPAGGFGLAGMRQRVQRLAGKLEVESEPGGGTAISATVPAIPAAEEAA
ncbi:sensor histidine kinase [Pseudactinotalea suaedae]|uniref:sensor histidine kinase n=1 Tax=Pseudactinotalea suaedae TaxID=1524924 RepID=UPI0012E28432|nr:sensor histidine kinase [Pseudactinotalea suaedae]